MKTILLMLTICAVSAMAQQPHSPMTRTEAARDLLSALPTAPARAGVVFDEESPSVEKKNVATAVVYSLLLPGMGELYAGNYASGKYFTIAEGTLWLTLGSVHWYANWLQDDARSFAVQHAGISPDTKADQYYVDIGNFSNTYAYNQGALKAREYFKTYDPNSSYAWNWDIDASRSQFRDMRVSADEMFNNTKFVAAVIGLNHLISAINAARAVIAHNKAVDTGSLIDIRARLLGTLAHPDGMMISVSRQF
jgi:hypothetical protein